MDKLNALERSAKWNADNWEPVTVVGTKDILAIVEAFRELEQRAAEAQLAGLEKQEARAGVVTVWPGTRSCDFRLSRPLPVGDHDVFTRSAPAAVPTKDQIREVFMRNGFTVKEGQTDLKPYVYDAAYALLGISTVPAAVPVDVVPGAVGLHDMDVESKDAEVIKAIAQCEGWNACRAEMLRRIEGLK